MSCPHFTEKETKAQIDYITCMELVVKSMHSALSVILGRSLCLSETHFPSLFLKRSNGSGLRQVDCKCKPRVGHLTITEASSQNGKGLCLRLRGKGLGFTSAQCLSRTGCLVVRVVLVLVVLLVDAIIIIIIIKHCPGSNSVVRPGSSE